MSFLKNILKKREKNLIKTSDVLAKINYESGTLFAQNNTNKVYIDIEDLGGFSYLKTVILGEIKTNIKRVGCTITLLLKNDLITLESDNTTVESNNIKNTKVNFTSIDFELTEKEVEKIRLNKIEEVTYNLKGKEYRFKCL